MGSRVKISGGMTRGWLSDIGKSDRVSRRVKDVADNAMRIAKTSQNRSGERDFDYAESVAGPGIWNSTYIVHPTSYMARKDMDRIETAAVRAGAQRKGARRRG